MELEIIIRSFAYNLILDFATHASFRMGERGIDIDSVYDCISFGKFLEKQSKEGDLKYLFQENCNDIPKFYVVVAYKNFSYPLVVTVVNFDMDKWKFDEDSKLMKRVKE